MRRSRTTFRLEGVEEDKTLENIKQEANEYLKGRSARSWLPRSSKTTAEEQPRDSLLGASLAQQCGSRTATITFGSEQLKKLYKKRKGSKEGSDLDDEFRGMTVLHQGCNEEPEIE